MRVRPDPLILGKEFADEGCRAESHSAGNLGVACARGQAGTGTWGQGGTRSREGACWQVDTLTRGVHERPGGPEALLIRALSAKVQMRLCRVQRCKSGLTTLRLAGRNAERQGRCVGKDLTSRRGTFPACPRDRRLLYFRCGSKGSRKRFRPSDKRPRVSSVRIAGAVISLPTLSCL